MLLYRFINGVLIIAKVILSEGLEFVLELARKLLGRWEDWKRPTSWRHLLRAFPSVAALFGVPLKYGIPEISWVAACLFGALVGTVCTVPMVLCNGQVTRYQLGRRFYYTGLVGVGLTFWTWIAFKYEDFGKRADAKELLLQATLLLGGVVGASLVVQGIRIWSEDCIMKPDNESHGKRASAGVNVTQPTSER